MSNFNVSSMSGPPPYCENTVAVDPTYGYQQFAFDKDIHLFLYEPSCSIIWNWQILFAYPCLVLNMLIILIPGLGLNCERLFLDYDSAHFGSIF